MVIGEYTKSFVGKVFIGGSFYLLPIWYLKSQDQDLTLGLDYGPKAIVEVWKVYFAQGPGCIQQRL